MAEGIAMSSDLHRAEAHGSVELSPEARFVGEAVNWLLSGMKPLEWKVVHLTHHAFTDREPTPEEWGMIQEQYPGAPFEAFRDPHSPILEGHLNVLFKNGLVYYRKAAKKIMPYLLDLVKREVPRELWPPHYKNVDLSQSHFERVIDKIPHGRMLGLTAVGGTILATRGPRVAALTMGAYIPGVLALGGGVNMMGHTGQVENEWERTMVILGLKDAMPDENGSYASNFFKNLAFLTAGEANHGDHHENPGNPFITSSTNMLKDPSGVLLKKLSGLTIAGRPLVNFPQNSA